MPEHKDLVINWEAMLKAITDDNFATTSQGTTAGDQADVAKQLQMKTICTTLKVCILKLLSLRIKDGE